MAVNLHLMSATGSDTGVENFQSPAEPPLTVFDIELDWDRHRAKRASRDIRLSALEFKLLRFLMLAPKRIFSREEIIAAVWPSNIHVGPRTVDVHIASLRKALDIPRTPNPLRTIRGRGYSLDVEAGAAP